MAACTGANSRYSAFDKNVANFAFFKSLEPSKAVNFSYASANGQFLNYTKASFGGLTTFKNPPMQVHENCFKSVKMV